MLQKCSSWKVFGVFASTPDKSFHIREIGRMLKLAPTSVKLHVSQLLKIGLVKRDTSYVFPSYKANFDSDEFRFYKRMWNLFVLKKSGVIEYLADSVMPDSIVLFGSYAKGEDTSRSDIDLFLLGKEKSFDLRRYELRLGRKIQLFFSESFNKLPAELRNNILNGVCMYGYLKVF